LTAFYTVEQLLQYLINVFPVVVDACCCHF
jgi:hypothetical protein